MPRCKSVFGEVLCARYFLRWRLLLLEFELDRRLKVWAATFCVIGIVTALMVAGCNQSQPPDGSKPGLVAMPTPPLLVGQAAPDFLLRDLDGAQVRLSDYRGRSPLVIEFGCFSCPIVTGRAGRLDQLAQLYQGRAQFWLIYGNEEHPGHGEMRSVSYGRFQALPQVQNYDDRCAHARLFRDSLKATRRILVDEDGSGSVATRYGIRGHGCVILDASGRITSIGDVPANLADIDNLLVGPPSNQASSTSKQGQANAHRTQPPVAPDGTNRWTAVRTK